MSGTMIDKILNLIILGINFSTFELSMSLVIKELFLDTTFIEFILVVLLGNIAIAYSLYWIIKIAKEILCNND